MPRRHDECLQPAIYNIPLITFATHGFPPCLYTNLHIFLGCGEGEDWYSKTYTQFHIDWNLQSKYAHSWI